MEKEMLSKQELAIAQLTSIYANSQTTKPPYSSPADFCFFAEDNQRYSVDVCNAFMSLVKDELLPSWCLEFAPVDELKKRADSKVVDRPRAWIGKGILILVPRIDGKSVNGALTVLGECTPGRVAVFDPDTNEDYQIILPRGINESVLVDSYWVLP